MIAKVIEHNSALQSS